jgi:hypothetical protein
VIDAHSWQSELIITHGWPGSIGDRVSFDAWGSRLSPIWLERLFILCHMPTPSSRDKRAELVLTSCAGTGHLPAETGCTSTSFTIFEGTSEIQRVIIGRAVTGLDVR